MGVADADYENVHWLLKLGWQLYVASGRKYITPRRELLQLEPDWVSDILYMDKQYRFLHNKSGVISMFEKQFQERGGDVHNIAALPLANENDL